MATIAERGAERNAQYSAHFRNLITTGRNHTYTTAEATRAQLARQIGLHYTPGPVAPLTIAGSSAEFDVQIDGGLAMPAKMSAAPNPRGIVIGLHGYGGSPDTVLSNIDPGTKGFGATLLDMGFSVVAPQLTCSYPGFGADRNHLDRLAQLTGFSLLGFEIMCLMRLADSLHHHGLPIYVCGFSQGALTALHFGALDQRLAGVASCSWFCNRERKLLSPEWWSYASAEEYDKFNPFAAPLWPDYLLGMLCYPRPLLITSGDVDYGRPLADVQSEFALIDSFYQANGAGGQAQLHIGQGEHEVFLEAVINFFSAF
ncbi:MAG: hypothetical protein E6Q97_15945 [Desulfurellales bacterium]|nr:MAG: hypothetical protein E6Q97_15945 [Desulfurellales bacterium]